MTFEKRDVLSANIVLSKVTPGKSFIYILEIIMVSKQIFVEHLLK